MRSSLKLNRDESFFQWFKEELSELKKLADSKEIDLCYFDETGLNLKPNVPYAWQLKGTVQELPAERSKKISVMGILNPVTNQFDGTIYQGTTNAECVIKTLDDYCETISKKTIIVLDNASIHKANSIKEKQKEWEEKGMFLQFIPRYCPELNLIEILWKHLKSYWLKPQDYESMETLEDRTQQILKQYGINEQYSITFV